jgi:hypothetical protein
MVVTVLAYSHLTISRLRETMKNINTFSTPCYMLCDANNCLRNGALSAHLFAITLRFLLPRGFVNKDTEIVT